MRFVHSLRPLGEGMCTRWLAVAGLLAGGCGHSSSPPTPGSPAVPDAADGGVAAAPPPDAGPPITIVPQPIAMAPGQWAQVGPGGGSMSPGAGKPDDPRIALAPRRRVPFRPPPRGAGWACGPVSFPRAPSWGAGGGGGGGGSLPPCCAPAGGARGASPCCPPLVVA